MTIPNGYHHSTQHCPRCRSQMYQSLAGASLCPNCKYERPPRPLDSITLGVHGQGDFDLLRPRLENLTARLKIGHLATLYDSGSHLAREWSLHLEVDLSHYGCGASMAGCAYVVLVGEPRLPLEQITQGVPNRLIRPRPR